MRTSILGITGLIIIACPLTITAETNSSNKTQNTSTTAQEQKHNYKEVDTNTLKRWYDQNKSILVVDARSKESFDENHLKNAKSIPYDTQDKEILSTLPSKDVIIVAYCWDKECPISEVLIDRLTALGYTNVYKYPEGFDDWNSKGYPVSKN